MKVIQSLPLFAICLAGLAMATQANALDIRQTQVDGCTNELVTYKIADAATATKFCSCSVGVTASMTVGQMWEIESYKKSGKDPATLPYAASLQQKMEQCSEGLTLNPPQQPIDPS